MLVTALEKSPTPERTTIMKSLVIMSLPAHKFISESKHFRPDMQNCHIFKNWLYRDTSQVPPCR